MKTSPSQRSAIKACACACAVLLASAWPSFAQTNSIERPVRPIKFSTAPLQLQPALQTKQHRPIPRPEPVQGVSLIPITFSTVVLGILAREPAQDPALTGTNQVALNAVEPRTGGTAVPRESAGGVGAAPAIQEPNVGRLQLVRPHPRLRVGRDETDRSLISEKPPGWVLMSIRF